MAVIKGSAVNQDGKTRNMTTPNGDSQQAVAHDALIAANIDPSAVSYLEAHGTGTPLGDPIEIESILKVSYMSHQTVQHKIVTANVRFLKRTT